MVIVPFDLSELIDRRMLSGPMADFLSCKPASSPLRIASG